MKIDFVSDVTCPWCAIGLHALERALDRLDWRAQVELRVQPFELNPDMPPEGEDIVHYVARKYGSTAEEFAQRQDVIRRRGAEVGFEFGARSRVWNTFDAHRLLHWAGLQGRQLELKRRLLAAYHTHGENPGARDVLLRLAGESGLDAERARDVLASGEFGADVRRNERHWQELGIHAVPAAIIDDRYLIEGGQPVEAFESALRRIAAGTADA